MKALSLKLGEWKETQRGTGGSGLKGSFKTRATDGNKGWGVEEITTQNKSLPMKQYFLHGPFQESFISMVFSAWLCSFMEDIRHVEGFLVAQMVKHLPAVRETGFNSWVGKIPWRSKWQFTPALLPGKSHGWRSLIVYNPRGCKESDTTEQLHFHFQACRIRCFIRIKYSKSRQV